MEDWRENLSIISRLKVAGKQADVLASRLFFERLFASADFHPPGISERAVVCIRKINAPPLKSSRPEYRVGNLTLDWEIGIRREVEKITRRAFRPLREVVPAQAESVIFEDKSEMLACLAQDWLGGALTEHWWWRMLFPNLFSAETPFKIWLAATEFVPAALHILSKSAAATEFVKKLKPPEASRLLHEIVRVFGLDNLVNGLAAPLEKNALKTAESNAGRAGKKRFQTGEDPAALLKSDALFASLIPESKAADFNFEQQVLLETGLLLARSPRIARSPEFAERVKTMRAKNELREAINGEQSLAVAEKKKPRGRDAAARPSEKRKTRGEVGSSVNQSPAAKRKTEVYEAQKAEKIEKPSEKPLTGVSKKREAARETSAIPKKIDEATPPAKIEFQTAQPEKEPQAIEQKAKASDEPFFKPPPTEQLFENFFEADETEVEHVFQTRFGGVFYLLNLGLYLGLYRDFTEELRTEIDLNIWDFVALLGLAFLGERIKTDAVWDFLKRAAGRENDDDFGREFEQFRDWRMPPEWLATFSGNQTWVWAKRKKRLVVRHADGFNVIDVSRRGAADVQLKNELENFANNFARIVEAGKKNPSPVKSRTWLSNLAEYLRKRLFQALNLQTPEELNALLFERRASVSVSATHLEITFALADLPIEVRLAGLDRNPAWIPAAGKFVYFHFV